MREDFVVRAEALLGELKGQEVVFQNRMAELQHDWSIHRQEIDKVESAITLYRRLMVRQNVASYGDLAQMTITDACAAVLKAHGGTADATLLVSALQEAGKLRSGKNAYNVVATQLYRSRDRFHRVGRGRWSLGAAPDPKSDDTPSEPKVGSGIAWVLRRSEEEPGERRAVAESDG